MIDYQKLRHSIIQEYEALPFASMVIRRVPTVRISEYGGVPCYFGKNSILVRDNWWWDEDLIFNCARFQYNGFIRP
jgi:hypothetical protein